MPANRKSILLLFLFVSSIVPLGAQTPGSVSAVGIGVGATSIEAIDAAKIAAVNALAVSTLKRDTVFRDLILSEAFKNDWFSETVSKPTERKRWEARTVVRVDESIVDALYYGRYSTTVGALLDGAESSVAEAETLLADGGSRESNGDLGGAETAYRRAESKINEAFRLVSPVEDAVFFSTVRKLKAPELKATISALRASAFEGLGRIKESRDKLSLDASYRNVLDLMQSVEDELRTLESTADEFYPIASSPRSYETARLSSTRDRCETASDALAKRRAIVVDRAKTLPSDMEYPRVRVNLVLDRLDTLERRFESTTDAVKSELFKRSPPVKAVSWVFTHAPSDRIAVGFLVPGGIRPGREGIERVSVPARANLRLEGAFPIGDGGFWCRTTAVHETEELYGGRSSSVVHQDAAAGFYGDRLMAIGLRWDWSRRVEGSSADPITALAFIIGTPGDSLGTRRLVPLWTTTFTWEIEPLGDLEISRDLNLGVSSVLRPSPWLRLEGSAFSRARGGAADRSYYAGAEAGFGFRLPPLRPFLWRLSWEGRYSAPFVDGDVDWDAGGMKGAFRFGLEYSF
jgi:hypothetical protein